MIPVEMDLKKAGGDIDTASSSVAAKSCLPVAGLVISEAESSSCSALVPRVRGSQPASAARGELADGRDHAPDQGEHIPDGIQRNGGALGGIPGCLASTRPQWF